MALIQCPECGNRVSELALQCPHCGFSIADTFREYICPDCGRIVKGKLNSCPDCDCPFDFFKTKGMDNLNHKQITNESSALVSHNILSQEYHYSQDNKDVTHQNNHQHMHTSNNANDGNNSKISWFISNNSGKLTDEKMMMVKEKMATMRETNLSLIMSAKFMSPVLVWVISFFFGYLGLDRFLIGNIGAGVGKLLTFGGFGIWWFIDLFLIVSATRESNFQKIASLVL